MRLHHCSPEISGSARGSRAGLAARHGKAASANRAREPRALPETYSLFDRQRIRRRSYASELVERCGGKEKLVAPICGASCGERGQLEHLAYRHAPQTDDRAVHHSKILLSVGRRRRESFKGWIVAGDS